MVPTFFSSKSLAIDLGNSNTLLSDVDQVLLQESSYIAFDLNTNRVKAIGDQAFDILGKNHEFLKPVQPLRWGVIADYESASAMIAGMVSRTSARPRMFGGYSEIVSGVPFAATAVEQRALRDVLDQFNSRKVYLVYEPLAAAIGIGMNIREPDGKMLVDIGGGITEVVIISISGIPVFRSLKTAGDSFTNDITDYLRRAYNLQIGWKTAEQLKMRAGAIDGKVAATVPDVLVKGKDLMLGLPVERMINSVELFAVLDKSFRLIEEQIIHALEHCPPELSSDIYQNGIHVTGGGALIKGIRERLERTLQVPIHLDQQPLTSVSKGLSKILANTRHYAAVLMK